MTAVAVTLAERPKRICIVAGQGLIGSRITHILNRLANRVKSVGITFAWSDHESVSSALLSVSRRSSANFVELVWSAGTAGFSATEAQMENEYRLFRCVVDGFRSRYGDSFAVNLISSAGGVHEGCRFVDSIHQEHPLRPYGEWKLKQEKYLASRDVFARVYRVSSAFGKGLAQHRKGLVLALIESAFSACTVNIHAKPSTLRDYVYDDDIAFHVARRILNQSGQGVEIIASGKPTSVDSLIKQIQYIIRRPVNASFRVTQENDRNIVFRKSVLARYFRITPLEESLRLLVSRYTSFA